MMWVSAAVSRGCVATGIGLACLPGLVVPSGACAAAPAAAGGEPVLAYDRSRGGGSYGPSITVDPCFAYYRRVPLAEVARRIRQQGFTCVHLVDYGAEGSRPEELKRFAEAFRAAGLSPVLCLYPGTHSRLYRQHPEWRQRMLTGIEGRCDWRTWLCPNRPEFVAAYCDHVRAQMRSGGFDGVQLAEIWFENWGGPLREGKPNPHYACVCEACLARFKQSARTEVDAREMLTKPESRWYFKKAENAALYARWVEMRVETIQDFGRAIINTARAVQPKACIKVMYMADARVELNGGREYLGNDLDRMVTEWQPEVVTFEDAWQDWLQGNLGAAFVAEYARAYKTRVEKLRPGVFLMSHADIGSRPESRRSVEWIRQFAVETVRAGFGAPAFYEWHVSRLAEQDPVPSAPSNRE